MTTDSDQVTWQELAGVLDALDLTPGYSNSTGRAFVVLADDSLLWAEVGHVTLSQHVPGADRLQLARSAAYLRKIEAEREAERAAITNPDALAYYDAARAREVAVPDPPGHLIDALLERQGRSTECR